MRIPSHAVPESGALKCVHGHCKSALKQDNKEALVILPAAPTKPLRPPKSEVARADRDAILVVVDAMLADVRFGYRKKLNSISRLPRVNRSW